MVEGDLKLDRCLMAVGDLGRTAGDELARLAQEHEIAICSREDLYSAVAELAARSSGRTLVIGRLSELTRENSVFFSIAARNGAACCCLQPADGPSNGSDVVAAVQAGARLIAGNGDLAHAIEEWLAADRVADTTSLNDLGLADEEFRTTQAELSALLGPETDD